MVFIDLVLTILKSQFCYQMTLVLHCSFSTWRSWGCFVHVLFPIHCHDKKLFFMPLEIIFVHLSHQSELQFAWCHQFSSHRLLTQIAQICGWKLLFVIINIHTVPIGEVTCTVLMLSSQVSLLTWLSVIQGLTMSGRNVEVKKAAPKEQMEGKFSLLYNKVLT